MFWWYGEKPLGFKSLRQQSLQSLIWQSRISLEWFIKVQGHKYPTSVPLSPFDNDHSSLSPRLDRNEWLRRISRAIVPSYPSKRVRMLIYFVVLITIYFLKLWERQFVVQIKVRVYLLPTCEYCQLVVWTVTTPKYFVQFKYQGKPVFPLCFTHSFRRTFMVEAAIIQRNYLFCISKWF
jgi:hypothetical protein